MRLSQQVGVLGQHGEDEHLDIGGEVVGCVQVGLEDLAVQAVAVAAALSAGVNAVRQHVVAVPDKLRFGHAAKGGILNNAAGLVDELVFQRGGAPGNSASWL